MTDWIAGIDKAATLVLKKLSDYRITDYVAKAEDLIGRLPGIIQGAEFQQEMQRFLPADTLDRTLRNPRFADYLARELASTFSQLIDALEGRKPAGPAPEFLL